MEDPGGIAGGRADPNIALAERVGLSPSPCPRRAKLLEEAAVIEGDRTIVNRKAAGLGDGFRWHRVDRDRETADAFVNAIVAMPEVVACHLVSGDVDFLIEAVVPDVAAYEATALRRLRRCRSS